MAFFGASVTLVISLLIWWHACAIYQADLLNDQHTQVEVQMAPYGDSLSSIIGHSTSHLEGMGSFVEAHPSKEELDKNFEIFASGIYSGSSVIRMIRLFPVSNESYVYLHSCNATGYCRTFNNLMDDEDPARKAALQETIRTGRTVVSDPCELQEGDMAVVARRAIYINGSLWGIAVLSLDFPSMIANSGLTDIGDDLDISLQGLSGQTLFGSNDTLLRSPSVYQVSLPEGNWELAAVPSEGWLTSIEGPLGLFQKGGLIISLLLTLLVYIVLSRGIFLKAEVEERTASLRESEGRYRQLFDSNSDPVFLVAEDGRIMDVNTVAMELYGYTRDELLEMVACDLSTPSMRDPASSPMEDILKNGMQFQWMHISRNGREFPVDINARPMELNGEKYILASVRDITANKEAEEAIRKSETKYRGLFENNTSEVVITEMVPDENGYPIDYVFLEVNSAFEKNIGLKAEDVVGKRVTEVYPGIEKRENTLLDLHRGVAITGIPVSVEIYLEEFNEYCIINAYRLEENIVVGVSQNITERKLAEIEVRKLNAELENRVAERTSELEKANKELEAFTYSVSHDLRAPLRAIDGFSRIILEDYAELLDDEGKRLLNVIRTNTQKMDKLITDLLGLSRIGRNKMHLTPVNMNIMVNSVYNDLMTDQNSNNIEFNVSDLPDSYADSSLIKQVWINLISNAIKYSSSRDKAVIDVGAYTEDGMNVYYVRDNGVGFDPKYSHKLFGIFQRLHSEKEFPGTGVGLAIVQRIAKRHGGDVWAESELNKGAIFYFSLPIKDGYDVYGE
jgi:PAS domain S-box-containing protein